mgnify:CR=1 FL=1
MTFEDTQDEYLIRCVVNTTARTFNLYSNLGEEKVVTCDTVQEFMNVLSVVRDLVSEDDLFYAEPLTAGVTQR